MNDGLSMDDIYMDDDTTNGGGDGTKEGQDSQDPFAGSDPEADALFNGTETVGSAGTGQGVQSSDDGASGTDPGIQNGEQSSSDGGLYGSVARALMEDGILHIDDASGVTDAASLRDAIEAEIYGRMNPMQQRVTAALNYGMRPDEIQEYEGALQELGGYTDEMVADESEDGVELRKNLIYQACLARGMNDKQAEREVDKSFKAGTDLEDAKDARSTIYDALRERYDGAMNERAEAQRKAYAAREEYNRALYDSVMNDDGRMVGDLTENTKRKVLGNMFGRTVRMRDGSVATPIEAMAASDPVTFQKAIGLAFTLTNGFRDFDRLAGVKAGKAVKRGIQGLEMALRGGSQGGSLRYANNAATGGDDGDIEILV